MRALHPDSALRRDGPHDVHPLAERGCDPAVRAQEAGVPDLREHADDARIYRADDRARPGHDSGMRRTGRQHHLGQHLAASSAESEAAGVRGSARGRLVAACRSRQVCGRERCHPRRRALPSRRSPTVAAPKTISAQALATKIDSFLASRGYKPPDGEPITTVQDSGSAPRADNPAEFICEDDVRAALRSGKKLLIGERTIITPAARDLGESAEGFPASGLAPLTSFCMALRGSCARAFDPLISRMLEYR